MPGKLYEELSLLESLGIWSSSSQSATCPEDNQLEPPSNPPNGILPNLVYGNPKTFRTLDLSEQRMFNLATL